MKPEVSARKSWWRRRLSLSLRALMILVLLIGALLGRLANLARVQREAVAAIKATGGEVFYEWQYSGKRWTFLARSPPWPKWLVNLVGVDYLGDVVEVNLREHDGSRPVDDTVLAHVGRLDHLLSLMVSGCPRVNDESLRQLRSLTRLKVIHIDSTAVRGSGLVHLAGMTQLSELGFSGFKGTDEDLLPLSRLPSLKSVRLSGPSLTDSALVTLEHMPDLEELVIFSDRITNSGLAHLRSRKLTRLTLFETHLERLKVIAPMLGLKELDLESDPINDDTLASLLSLQSLESLTLMSISTSMSVTDAGLQRLAELRSLTKVSLLGTTQISRSGVAAFKAKRPTLLLTKY